MVILLQYSFPFPHFILNIGINRIFYSEPNEGLAFDLLFAVFEILRTEVQKRVVCSDLFVGPR